MAYPSKAGILVTLTVLCITFILPLLGLTLIPWQDILNNINHH